MKPFLIKSTADFTNSTAPFRERFRREVTGEIPKAYIVKRGEIDAEQVMAFVAERVSPYKKVRQVEFVDAIPKSPSGKILRRLLRDRERATPAG